mmetsp:Transcript_4698/g.9831  ORF Transcript_4698/g.9831 Transcript_4698/m.9831 type:complete len:82 (-) Transcript_4698:595-840(-)
MISASLFSGLIGSSIPGSVYLDQHVKFVAPVFVGEEVKAEVVLESFDNPARAKFSTTVYKDDGSIAISGTAHALIPKHLRR